MITRLGWRLAAAAFMVFGITDALAQRAETRRAEAISPAIFEKMERSQEAMDAEDYDRALAGLDAIREGEGQLNSVEIASLYNLYAGVYMQQGRTGDAIAAYRRVLQIEGLREEMRNRTLFAVGQSYFIMEDYERAIRVLERWFELVEQPSPSAYVLLAQGHYQNGDYEKSEQVLLNALSQARNRGEPLQERWLALLRAVYYEMEEYGPAARILEVMVQRWPQESYYLQLAGMYGLMEDRRRQAAVLHAAAVSGMLSDESTIVNLARLYLVEGAPYPATEVLKKGLENGVIKVTSDNLQLYAQALGFAKEYESQVEVLERLAAMTGDARHYVFLGQGLSELGRFREAATAFRNALESGEAPQPDRVLMQMGTAQFNAGQLRQARNSFEQAKVHETTRENAEQWIIFVEREMQRRAVLEGMAG